MSQSYDTHYVLLNGPDIPSSYIANNEAAVAGATASTEISWEVSPGAWQLHAKATNPSGAVNAISSAQVTLSYGVSDAVYFKPRDPSWNNRHGTLELAYYVSGSIGAFQVGNARQYPQYNSTAMFNIDLGTDAGRVFSDSLSSYKRYETNFTAPLSGNTFSDTLTTSSIPYSLGHYVVIFSLLRLFTFGTRYVNTTDLPEGAVTSADYSVYLAGAKFIPDDGTDAPELSVVSGSGVDYLKSYVPPRDTRTFLLCCFRSDCHRFWLLETSASHQTERRDRITLITEE